MILKDPSFNHSLCLPTHSPQAACLFSKARCLRLLISKCSPDFHPQDPPARHILPLKTPQSPHICMPQRKPPTFPLFPPPSLRSYPSIEWFSVKVTFIIILAAQSFPLGSPLFYTTYVQTLAAWTFPLGSLPTACLPGPHSLLPWPAEEPPISSLSNSFSLLSTIAY